MSDRSVHDVFSAAVTRLDNESKRRQLGTGVRSREVDQAVADVASLLPKSGPGALPFVDAIADSMGNMLLANDQQYDEDRTIWRDAATCASIAVGSFWKFAQQVFVVTSRRRLGGLPAPLWLVDEATCQHWDAILLSTSDVATALDSFPAYLVAVGTGLARRDLPVNRALLQHLTTLVLLADHVEGSFLRRCMDCAADALTMSAPANPEVAVTAMRLRAAVSAVRFPRTAPVAVPVSVTSATHAEPVLAPAAAHVTAQLSASRHATFVAPVATQAPREEGSSKRHADSAVPRVRVQPRAEGAPEARDDSEIPMIVDDDLC